MSRRFVVAQRLLLLTGFLLLAGLLLSGLAVARERGQTEEAGAWARTDLRFSGQVTDMVALGENRLGIVVITRAVAAPNEAPNEALNGESEPTLSGDSSNDETNEEGGQLEIEAAGQMASDEQVASDEGSGGTVEEAKPRSLAEIWIIDLGVTPAVTRRLVERLEPPVRLVTRDDEETGSRRLLALLDDEVLDFGAVAHGALEPIAFPRRHKAADLIDTLISSARGGDPLRGVGAAEAGHLKWWSGGDLGTLPESYPLPLLATPRRWGLRLSSPSVSLLGEDGGALSYVVGPMAYGRRLRSVVHGSDGETFDAWSLMPGEEQLHSSEYVLIDGELFLLTTSTTERGIFTKLELSLYPIRQDRSRSGLPPLLRWDLDCYSWFTPSVVLSDVDGDGRDDLLVAFGEGLGGGDLVIQRTRGAGGGRFSVAVDRKKINLDGDAWNIGSDVDGDGLEDLVVVSDSIEVFAGRDDRRLLHKGETIATDIGPEVEQIVEVVVGSEGASASTEPGAGGTSRLRVEDLDGDGVAEILVTADEGKRGALIVLRRLRPW